MRLALHPATSGGDKDLMGDYCKYLRVNELFYQLHDVPSYRDGALDDIEALKCLQENYSAVGLKFSALNDFLPNDPAALRSRCEGLLSTLDLMADAQVKTLILFVLQDESEEIWAGLTDLYKALVPKAQSLGVKIATHGHWCEGHIAYNRKTIERIINIDPSPANGMCLCAGCYHQAGDDPAAMIKDMPERIHSVHIRDTSLTGGCDLQELPLGAGSVNIPQVISALIEINYTGLIIPEHLSTVNIQQHMEVTHAHAVGYLQGIIDGLVG